MSPEERRYLREPAVFRGGPMEDRHASLLGDFAIGHDITVDGAVYRLTESDGRRVFVYVGEAE